MTSLTQFGDPSRAALRFGVAHPGIAPSLAPIWGNSELPPRTLRSLRREPQSSSALRILFSPPLRVWSDWLETTTTIQFNGSYKRKDRGQSAPFLPDTDPPTSRALLLGC